MRLPPVIHVVLRRNLISIFFPGPTVALGHACRSPSQILLMRTSLTATVCPSGWAKGGDMLINWKKKKTPAVCSCLLENTSPTWKKSFVLLSNLVGSRGRGVFNEPVSSLWRAWWNTNKHYHPNDGSVERASNISKRHLYQEKNDPWNLQLVWCTVLNNPLFK